MASTAAERPGADADRPSDIPAPGWKQIAVRAWKEASEDNISLIAAGVAFYAFLAFVPLLAALVLTYGLVAEPSSVVSHMQSLTQAMPADAAKIIGDQLQSVVQTAGSKKGFGLLLAIALALYGATKGATSIMTATNIAWDVEEKRGFVKRTLLAFAFTAGALIGLLLAIVGVSVLGFIDHLLPTSAPWVHTLLRILFWIPAAAAVSLGVALIYRYAPDRRPVPAWRWISPGSIIVTIVWLIATAGFGFYVANFGNYNATYGSLGAVIVFLTWLYLTAYILLMGAELNAEVERQTDQNTKAKGKDGEEARPDKDPPPSTWLPKTVH
ncbi:MAG TPA: YihY/virulence factor BrkB family protein [Allosphingosinicella sp.]|uniref:YihY/virulence factor BrkB family protein n=1 Tax=Allosphingosinicella sp. TaxID=2823234 RepID=UPI002ED85EE3